MPEKTLESKRIAKIGDSGVKCMPFVMDFTCKLLILYRQNLLSRNQSAEE